LADKIHGMKGEKKLVVVISPNVSGYPSAEVPVLPLIPLPFPGQVNLRPSCNVVLGLIDI